MKKARQQNKIGQKLKKWYIISSALLLILISLCLFTFELHQLKSRAIEKLNALTEVLGANSTAAISFDDKDAAKEILNALTHQEDIQAAFILDKHNQIFASYGKNSNPDISVYYHYIQELSQTPQPKEDYDFSQLGLHVYAPIVLGGEQIGTIHAFDSMGYMYQAVVTLVIVLSIALLSLLALAYALSLKLSKMLTDPILQLKNTMEVISEHKDYNTEVSIEADDEIGDLYQEFNNMLKEIYIRDLALEAHNKQLEREVRERTQEIRIANEQLQKYITRSQEARIKAEDLAKAKSLFLANMSHEIRTPLNGIIGIIEIISKTQLNEKQKEFIHIAQMCSETLLQLVNDVLDVSKIESGQLQLESRVVDVHHLMESILTQFISSAMKKNLVMKCNIKPKNNRCYYADELRIKQIFSNLISNALKFTEKGEIVITWEDIKPIDEKTDRLYFSVRDTGKGISSEYMKTIFQPFTQEDLSTTRKYGGTGLGLNICKRMVELMDGQLSVESKLDEGTTFYFELSLKRAHPIVEPEELLPALKKLPILIVEDQVGDHAHLQRYLQSVDTPFKAIQNPENTLNELKAATQERHPFSLIIIHIGEIKSLALELVSFIRKEYSKDALKIIVIGSLADKDNILEQDDAIQGFLVKPFDADDVINLISEVCFDKSLHKHAQEEGGHVLKLTETLDILVAEDNEVNQQIIKIKLERLGAKVVVADNGKIAVEQFKQNRFDLVFMDCQMPEMDGFQATRLIRSYEKYEKLNPTPVIALTGNVTAEDRQACFDAQMNDFVQKPFSEQDLISMINKWSGYHPEISALSSGQEVSEMQAIMETDDPIMINQKRFLQVMNLGSDPTFAKQILIKFNESTQFHLDQVISALENKDYTQIQNLCHMLKSSCLSLGAESLGTLCATIEKHIKNNEYESVPGLCGQLHSIFVQTTAQLESLRSSHEPR